MSQLKVKDLKALLSDKDDNLDIYFRRVAPITGNVEQAYGCVVGKVSHFGVESDCIIIEPEPEISN